MAAGIVIIPGYADLLASASNATLTECTVSPSLASSSRDRSKSSNCMWLSYGNVRGSRMTPAYVEFQDVGVALERRYDHEAHPILPQHTI